MKDQRLHRANSFIRARKERAGIASIKQIVIKPLRGKTLSFLGSFLTSPNAFKQCTIALLIFHSAIFKVLKYIFPGGLGISLEPWNPLLLEPY
jgi:hypothetical protein